MSQLFESSPNGGSDYFYRTYMAAVPKEYVPEFRPFKLAGLEPTVSPLRVLRLTLKRRWFDMIASGKKREEYRTPGKWIESRLRGKDYDVIEFKNGYGPNVPTLMVQFQGWHVGHGYGEWGAIPGATYIVIRLGKVIPENDQEATQPLSPTGECLNG